MSIIILINIFFSLNSCIPYRSRLVSHASRFLQLFSLMHESDIYCKRSHIDHNNTCTRKSERRRRSYISFKIIQLPFRLEHKRCCLWEQTQWELTTLKVRFFFDLMLLLLLLWFSRLSHVFQSSNETRLTSPSLLHIFIFLLGSSSLNSLKHTDCCC